MKTRLILRALLFAVLLAGFPSLAKAQQRGAIRFEQFPVTVYRGHLKVPSDLRRDSDGIWRDEAGKAVNDPAVNFAGNYYLSAHSCGTCCRYYTMDNLRTGGQIREIGMFDASEGAPHVTKDGRDYVPILYFKPGSKLLIAQYMLDLCTPAEEKNECRQRYFVFESGHFKAISSTLHSCTREGEEPE